MTEQCHFLGKWTKILLNLPNKVIGYKMPHVVPKWLVWKMKMDRKGTRNTYLSGNILHYKVFKIIFN